MTMTVGVGKSWAICQPDDDECYCRTHPGECDDAPAPTPDYSAVAAAAKAKVRTMTTATPLDIQASCDSANSAGQGICGVTLWINPTNSDGYHCTVSYEMDGWGNTEIVGVSCGVNNG